MSYVMVPAEKVAKVAEEGLAFIELLRVKEQAAILFKEANRKRWFGYGKPWGYQKAFEILENDDTFSLYKMKDIKYGAQFSDCEDLLALAKLGDPVMITDKHAYLFK